MSNYSVLQLPANERPRERLVKHGPEAMSTVELIAIILGSGTKGISVLQLAHEIMVRFDSPLQLAEASLEELSQIKGLGPAKALQLKAAIGLGVRVSKHSNSPKYRIDNPIHAYHLVRDELQHEKQEHVVVILLDTKGYSIGTHTVAMGTLDETAVHSRDVFFPAIRHKASSLILVHNHPSGDPTPSMQDFETTKNLVAAGHLIGIPINDHLIIGSNTYVSLRQKGFSFD